jgi:hypothetical protein
MAIKGVFTSDSNITGTRKGDFASAILQLFPTGTAPLFALSSGMESADTSDPIVNWFEEAHISGRSTVSVGTTNNVNGQPITVDDASSYTTGTVCLVEETGEYIYISAAAGNVITLERGFGGTAISNISAANHLQRIGNAFEEASQRPTGVANLGYARFNFTQIFRNAWDVSRTAKRTQFYTGDPVSKNKSDAMLFHSEDIERAMWFGKRTIGVRNGKTFRTMDGVANQIVTNVTTAGGTTSFDQLDTFLRPIFEKNVRGKPNERIAFCGNVVLTVINKIARANSTMYIEPGQTDFGLKVTKWFTPYGDISLMTHPLFVENPVWTKNMYVLHPGAVRMRYLDRTHTDAYDKDGTRAGVDGDFGVLTTECTIEYKLEKTGGQFLGLTAGT